MRIWCAVASVLLGLPPLAPAQPFGVTHPMLPVENDPAMALALGDVDGDGDPDAYLGFDGQNRLYLDDGNGTFADVTATNLPAVLDVTRAVALGDVDGDGDLDAFAANDGQDRLHLNNGTGVFTEATATNLPFFFGNARAVALGDVDGDGDLDAYLGNGAGSIWGQEGLFLNDGTGVFADATATNLPVVSDLTFAVALGDVDGDGDLDAFVGNYG